MLDLKRQLRDNGFSEKETSVYLAMLELGPSSIQDIAEKADVNRATTYLMVESLKKRGLVSSSEQGKKTLLTAETPQRLHRITDEALREIEDRRRGLESVMPQFMALFNSIQHKPRVRFFEGEEGVITGREALRGLLKGEESCSVFIHYDAAMIAAAKRSEEDRLRLIRSVSTNSILYSTDAGIDPPLFPRNTSIKRIPPSVQPFHGECAIYDHVVLLGTTRPLPMVILIESTEFSTLLRRLFEIAWLASSAEK